MIPIYERLGNDPRPTVGEYVVLVASPRKILNTDISERIEATSCKPKTAIRTTRGRES